MKTTDVYLNEYYMIGGVKTEAGVNRIIPIAYKIYDFIKDLYNTENTYLLSFGAKRYSRDRFLTTIWNPAMNLLDLDHLPHNTRYTCAIMMDRSQVNENSKKTILGHSKEGVTNKVYVEKDLADLLEAINMI